jgi:hypothetical protein
MGDPTRSTTPKPRARSARITTQTPTLAATKCYGLLQSHPFNPASAAPGYPQSPHIPPQISRILPAPRDPVRRAPAHL